MIFLTMQNQFLNTETCGLGQSINYFNTGRHAIIDSQQEMSMMSDCHQQDKEKQVDFYNTLK